MCVYVCGRVSDAVQWVIVAGPGSVKGSATLNGQQGQLSDSLKTSLGN